MAATLDSGIVADMITTGILKSIEIQNGENFRVDSNGNVEIKANSNNKYKYTDLDIYLALAHVKGLITLPDELLNLYRCVSSGNNFTVTDVSKMMAIKNGEIDPIKSVDVNISIDNKTTEKTILLKSSENLQTLIGLFQIYTYMMKCNYLFIGDGYSTGLSTTKYGIQLDGREKKIQIIDDTAQVGTTIDSSKVNTGISYASDGIKAGRCMHSPDVDISGPDHVYMCHSTGNALVFNVDPNPNTDFNVSAFWISSGSSDRRLKRNIKKINKNLLKFINEIELKEFIFKDDEENKITFGAIAQDLISLSRKYNINIWNYNLVIQGITYKDKKGKSYYAIDYTQLLILKTKCLEKKIINLDNNYEKLKNRITNLERGEKDANIKKISNSKISD